MPRIKLTEQLVYEFYCPITVRVTDLNYGGHLGNDTLVSYLHQARADIFRNLGYGELDLGDGQTGIIMADLCVNFVTEGFMFDEIALDSHIADVNQKSLRIFHRLRKRQELVALAETGILAFHYPTRQTVPWPKAFLQAITEYQAKF